MSIHLHIGCFHEIEIQIFEKYGFLIGRKNRLDTKIRYTSFISFSSLDTCPWLIVIITSEYIYI